VCLRKIPITSPNSSGGGWGGGVGDAAGGGESYYGEIELPRFSRKFPLYFPFPAGDQSCTAGLVRVRVQGSSSLVSNSHCDVEDTVSIESMPVSRTFSFLSHFRRWKVCTRTTLGALIGRHRSIVVSTASSQLQGPRFDSRLARSSRICVGFLRVLRFPPTLQRCAG